MAVLFVDDGGSNTSPFDTWAKAADGSNTGGLQAALADAACVAGSTVYIGHNSTTTYTATATYSSKGTFAAPVNVYSVTSGDETTYNVGAIEDTSGDVYDINTDGFANIYGVHFKSGNNIGTASGNDNETWQFTDCHLELASAVSTDSIALNQPGSVWKLFNTDITFGHIAQGITLYNSVSLFWYGGTLNANTNILIIVNYGNGGQFVVRGVDLSAMTGSGTKFIFDGFGVASFENAFFGHIVGCKLAASDPPVLVQDTTAVDGVYLEMIGCGSAAIPQTHIHTSQGDIYHETSIVRDAKYDGTNKYSYKLISNANASRQCPLRFMLVPGRWMAANPTITVHISHNDLGAGTGGMFEKHECWLEIEHPDATVPAYRTWDRTNTETSPLVTGNDNGTDSGTSNFTNSEGLDQEFAETLTSGAGIVTVWLCLGLASKTIYACPRLDVT